MKTSKLLLAAAMTALVGASQSAGAASTTAPLTVQITVTSNCTINTSAGAGLLDFGSHAGGAAVLAATGSSGFTVQCTDTTPYNITMSPTGGSTTGSGNMTNGTTTDTVAFALCSDSTACATPWGNVTGVGANDVTATGNGLAQPYTVYGKVTGASPASGYVKPVVYQNATTITVNY
jgi:spore coat protein U-like protein